MSDDAELPDLHDAIFGRLEQLRQAVQLLATETFGAELGNIDPLPTTFANRTANEHAANIVDAATRAATSAVAGIAAATATQIAVQVIDELFERRAEGHEVHYHAPDINVAAPRPLSRRIERDKAGRITRVVDEPRTAGV